MTARLKRVDNRRMESRVAADCPAERRGRSVRETIGYLVVDSAGRRVGYVELEMYGRWPEIPDAVAVRASRFRQRRYIVPLQTIAAIDRASRVVSLRVERSTVRPFL
jgi:hypothetical protein